MSADDERATCSLLGACGRNPDHRGQHGGHRALAAGLDTYVVALEVAEAARAVVSAAVVGANPAATAALGRLHHSAPCAGR